MDNIDKIKKELDRLCGDKRILGDNSFAYFSSKLFEEDDVVYLRRSFEDLYKYFNSEKVNFKTTEEELVQALYEGGFRGKICANLKKIIFFRFPTEEGVFLEKSHKFGYLPMDDDSIVDSIYNPSYINNIFDKIYNNK